MTAIEELHERLATLKEWRDNPEEYGYGYEACIDFYERLLADIDNISK